MFKSTGKRVLILVVIVLLTLGEQGVMRGGQVCASPYLNQQQVSGEEQYNSLGEETAEIPHKADHDNHIDMCIFTCAQCVGESLRDESFVVVNSDQTDLLTCANTCLKYTNNEQLFAMLMKSHFTFHRRFMKCFANIFSHLP